MEEFKARYEKLTSWEEFSSAIAQPLRKSIRVNTIATSAKKLKGAIEAEWNLDPVPWCPEGFWIAHKKGERQDIGNVPGHKEGHFFVQEAASMIPAVVLGPMPGENVLDACASPGAKTTQIAQYMGNTGALVALDVRQDRIAILRRNVERMKVTNCVVEMSSVQQLTDIQFDRVLADAPCTGTGILQKSPETAETWSPELAKRLSDDQKSILHSAYCLLKKGGRLVYSTCSVDPQEDEAVVSWLLKRHKKSELEEIILPGLKRSEPVLEFEGEKYNPTVERCLRIWPQDNNTSGFFVASIRKLGRKPKGI
ncbi:MAG: RsmB/NOP family class I SAM-dependent RNA methyltransferase [archaeon]